MKIVIDIPDEVYNFTKNRGHLPYGVNIAGSIIDGTPLPKGHGDLIDRNVVYAEFNNADLSRKEMIGKLIVFGVPTVISADK